jgi:phage terminase large subunit-like protein
VPYLQWIADGYVETTPGNATDYDFVEQKIMDLSGVYSIQSIGYDAAYATQLAISLTDKGIVMDRVAQGPATMNQVIERIENLAIWKPNADSPVTGRINHLGNPVLRWMIGNVTLKRDAGGRAMLDKAKSVERIDGVSALCDAMVQWMMVERPDGGISKYETESFFIV